jgi:hypothetical protein
MLCVPNRAYSFIVTSITAAAAALCVALSAVDASANATVHEVLYHHFCCYCHAYCCYC